MARGKRKSKSLEIYAKLMRTGISIPSAWNRNRLMLEADNVPPEGVNVKLTISFISRSKSSELLGFYFGAILPLWVAHKKDLIEQNTLEKNPLALRELIMKKKIKKFEIDDAHADFMLHFRPVKSKNWLTGKTEKKRDSLSDMDAYNAALYVSEVYQYVQENSGIVLNTKEFKNARDSVETIIQRGKSAAPEVIEYPENNLGEPVF